MVRGIELAPDDDVAAARVRKLHARLNTFFSSDFDAALEEFRARGLISEEELESLRSGYQQSADIARRYAAERLRRSVRQAVDRLLAEELTLAQARQAIVEASHADIEALGLAPRAPHYLDNAIRTSVSHSYGAGRWRAMTSPDVVALRPYMRYVTAGDSQVRASHRRLHGIVFRVDSPEAARVAPPNGYRCRCAGTTLSQRQLEARGYAVTEGDVEGGDPDPGWDRAPVPLSE